MSSPIALEISLLAVLCVPGLCFAQTAGSSESRQVAVDEHRILSRRYHVGEKLAYHMNGNNRDRVATTNYEADAHGEVKKDTAGKFFEEYAWSNLVVNGKPVALSAAAKDFRQSVSLDPDVTPAVPNLSQVLPLIGPITDLLTFYSDLWLAKRLDKLHRAGDHFYFASGTPNSWADGIYTVVGEDSIDFDLALKYVDTASHTATLVVSHVPPTKPQIKLPAAWMSAPVADTPNNWVQVQKSSDGKYSAEVGKETFDVELKVSLDDGKILSATLDNPVEVLARECADAALSSCGEPVRYQIHRQVEIAPVHYGAAP
jgi:hypothetical protein